ncbi:DUF5985 family protein [Massilia glaciei]|uniref:Uncharacterized protein n=1 Tax=Massilia glaciei TaxID=1524097 RepID=A0A2U2HGF5_9BURK|nr:DUF5985 family protein [Massilia glaciei]PWF43996.1 hypothetical protein C7C56_020115 [Massilia glaciei]
MAATIYALCALTALACACLILRSYYQSKYRLLLWSGLCFAGLFINNLILMIDRLMLPATDLSTWRLLAALGALLPLLYGLILEDE